MQAFIAREHTLGILEGRAGRSNVYFGSLNGALGFKKLTQSLHIPSVNNAVLERPCLWLVVYMAVSAALYFLVTHFPMGPVRIIEASGFDKHIPLVVYTVPLYLSYLALMPTLVYLGRRTTWLIPGFFAAALAAAICLVIHLFWPTLIVRPQTDLAWLLWLYQMDPPLAASPSGHIALPVAIGVCLAGLRVRHAATFALWSAVLAVSVLTTGQHVVFDVIYGIAVGVACGLATLLIKRLTIDMRTMGAILLEWLCIIVTLRIALYSHSGLLYVAAAVIIATRQHALFILYHDATHYHLTRRRHVNDFLINMAIGVPGCVPVEVYRPLHLEHHQHLGTSADPERRFLYHGQPWTFRPLNTKQLLQQLTGDLFIVNTVRNLRAYKQSGGTSPALTRPLAGAVLVWLVIITTLVWTCSARQMALLAMLWFIPLVTLGSLLQKIRSMAEHSGGPGITPGWQEWTYAWRVGWLGRFFIWPYHINLHLQHHRTASLPWHALPSAVRPTEQLLPSRALLALLWSGCRQRP